MRSHRALFRFLTRPLPGSGPALVALFAGCVFCFTALMIAGGYVSLTNRSPWRDATGLLSTAIGIRQAFAGQAQVNILLVGVDETFGRGPSDTIMVWTIRPAEAYAAMLSLPRDLYTRSPRLGPQKINAMYSYGGVNLVREAVGSILGIPIDHYVKVDTRGFRAVVDAAGGVEVTIEHPMHYHTSHLTIDLEPGRQRLDGDAALDYVRFRSDALGDLGRTRRQQRFLRELARQLFQPARAYRIPRVITTALQYVETDLDAGDLMALTQLAQQLDLDQVPTATLPALPVRLHHLSFLVTDERWIEETVRHLFDRKPVYIEILNGTRVNRLATRVAQLLDRNGLPVNVVDNAPYRADATEVLDNGGISSTTARAIARLLGTDHVRTILDTTTPLGVRVVLGPDAENRVASE